MTTPQDESQPHQPPAQVPVGQELPSGYEAPAGYGTSPGTETSPTYGTPPGFGTPGYGTPGYGTPPDYGTPSYGTTPGQGATGYGTPPGYGTAASGTPPGYGAGAYGAPPPGYGTPPQPDYGMPPQAYGMPQPYGYPYPYAPAREHEGLAIASLVVSCAAVFGLCTSGFAGVLGIVGAILGHVARSRIKRNGRAGGGMALAGIIVGWILTAVCAVLAGFAIYFFVHGSDSYDGTPI